MAELYRLRGESENTSITLVLTDTQLLIEPSPEFRAKLATAFAEGRQGAAQAPRFVGWIVEKAVNFASNQIERIFEPHELTEITLKVRGDELNLKLGKVNFKMVNVKVDPAEAYIFDSKFRNARKFLR